MRADEQEMREISQQQHNMFIFNLRTGCGLALLYLQVSSTGSWAGRA